MAVLLCMSLNKMVTKNPSNVQGWREHLELAKRKKTVNYLEWFYNLKKNTFIDV